MMIKRLLYLRNTFASLAVLLVLLVSGNGFGQGTFGTPIFSENFGSTANNVSLTTTNTNFSYVRVGTSTTSNSITNKIVANNPSSFTNSSMIIGAKGTSISTVDKTGLTSFNKGAFTFKFKTPSSLSSAVLFGGVGDGATFGSNNGFSGSQLSTALQVNGTNLQIRAGSNWTTVQSITTSTNYTVTIVFNNSGSSLFYGNGETLPNNKVHIYIDGTKMGEYSVGNNLTAKAFRIYTTTAEFEVDDIAVYNELPTSSATSYTVTFNGNGNTGGSMADQTASTETALTANTFTRTGYAFAGWATTASGAVAYANEALFPFTANTTLYAQWTPITPTYTVTFNGNGATGGSMLNQTASTETALTANGFTRTGYAFAGWNTAANGSGTPYADGANFPFTANATLYALWAPITTTLANNGAPVAAGNVTQGTNNNILGSFTLAQSGADATLTQATFLIDGNFVNGDVVTNGIKLYTNTTNNFATATSIGSLSVTEPDVITFSGLTQTLTKDATRYFWVTADIAIGATPGKTINLYQMNHPDLVVSTGTISGSTTVSGEKTIVSTPVPTLSVTPTTLPDFDTTCINTDSAIQTYTLTGVNLSGNVTVTAPAGFKVRKGTEAFAGSTTVTPVSGSINIPIDVIFSPTTAPISATYSIQNSGGGAALVITFAPVSSTNGTVAVATETANTILTTTATSGGSSVSTSCGTITAKGVVWDTAENPTVALSTKTNDGTGVANYSSNITGLTENTVYNVRAYATNSNAVTSYGANSTFTTLSKAPTAPIANTATVNGFTASWTAPASQGNEALTYTIKIYSNAALTTQVGSAITGITTTSTVITSLSQNTTYYYTVEAVNETGSSAVASFTTGITTLSGPCLFEDFVDFSNWTASNQTISTTSSQYGLASPAKTLAASSNITSPPLNNPMTLSFYQDSSTGGNGNTATISYKIGSGDWTLCYSFSVSTNGSIKTVDLTNIAGVDLSAHTDVLLRFESSFNTWYLDDVEVFCGIPCQAPTVTLQETPVTAITTQTVSLHGNVTAQGGFAINTRGFEYSVNSNMTASATQSSAATTTGTYSENITGLTPNTVYYYRAYATNDCNPNKTGYSHTSAYPTFTTLHNAPNVGTGTGATSTSFTAQWTAPTGGGSAAFTYEIEVDDDSNFGSVNFTANGITGISTLVNSGLTASTTYYYRVRAVNLGGNSAWSATSVGYATTAPAPEINIKQGATTIASGNTYTFGNQISGTSGTAVTFTVENTGNAALSVGLLSKSGTDDSSFTITQPLSATVAAGDTTTFTVTFAPTTTGSKTAQLSLINGDADENPYIINLTGTGTRSVESVVKIDPTFTGSTAINYLNYTGSNVTDSNSYEAGRFIVYDGNGITSDSDNLATILNSITFNVSGSAALSRIAIYDGTQEIAEISGSTPAAFSSLNLSIPDGEYKTLSIRVLFNTNSITDKQLVKFSLFAATASTSGSNFGTSGSQQTPDQNIEITADRLAFTTQPTNVGINSTMANVVVAAVDINNNKDADATGTVTLTSTGSMTSSPLSGTLVSGSVTFSSIVHTVAQTGRNLIAKKTGFADLNSNLFDVTAIDYVTGDIVSTYDGTGLSYSSGWQYFNGSTLTTVPDNKGPESTSTTIATVYINHIVDGGGNADKNYNCNFVIGNGGKLTLSDVETTPSTFIAASKRIEVLSGGTLQIDGDMGVNSTGKVIVRSGGTLIINSTKATNSHPMWTGEENFENGSTVIINNWKWDASPSIRSLMNTSTDIKNNDGGYKFGNLIIDINPTDSFVLIGGGIGVIKLCQNDLEINNSSTNYVHGASNASTAGFEIGGNMIIYDGPFSFGANFSSGTNNYTHNFIINGNFNCESNDALKINYRSNGTNTLYGTVTFRGNVTIGSNVSSITQDVSNSTRMNVILEGGNALIPKYIDIAPTAVAIPMTINNGYRKLQNHDLNLNSVTGYTTSFTLKSGATLDFGLSSTNTALNIKSILGVEGTNAFIAENGSTLKITSAGGIATSGDTGNVQTTTRTFSASDYQYTGIANQITGTGLPTSGAKITIANTGTAPDNEVRLTNESTSVSALEITNGVFNLNEKTLTGTNLSIAENATLKIVGTQSFPTFTNKTFHNNGIVEYGGTNQSIAALTSPTYTKLKVSGTGKKVLSGTSVEVGNSLNITSSLLEISEGQTLRVQNEITTVDTDATNGLFIKNGGSLVQIANVDNQTTNTNVGNIKMERNTTPMNKYDYTYWSSPVAGVTLNALSPDTHPNRYYSYNAVTGAWSVITGGFGTMLEGKGYIIRAPNNYLADSYQNYTGNFTGKTHNGLVTPTINGPDKWNLLGNPYPSAVDADLFLEENEAKLGGTLYFWTHNSPFTSNGYAYSSGDYASWNGVGGTNTTAAGNTGNGINTAPAGKIAAGQGFFVQGLVNGTAEFNNTMRIAGENSQFFRSTTSAEKHRIWLNLQGGTDGFSQTLVGYVTNATNGIDHRFDGTSFGGNSVTFYSVMENKNWTIQGRALPFSTADEVPLGYKTTLTGNLIISIDDKDGLLATQTIYLKDNLLNVVHNLTESPYTFASVPGTFDDRFVLRYLPGQDLDNPTFEDQMDGLSIRKNNADIHINSSFENIDAVLIYDIMGRLLFEKEKCNTQTFKTSNVTQSEQMLIIKVRLNNGAVVTKKVW